MTQLKFSSFHENKGDTRGPMWQVTEEQHDLGFRFSGTTQPGDCATYETKLWKILQNYKSKISGDNWSGGRSWVSRHTCWICDGGQYQPLRATTFTKCYCPTSVELRALFLHSFPAGQRTMLGSCQESRQSKLRGDPPKTNPKPERCSKACTNLRTIS